MRQEKKKKLIAIFILVVFAFSSLAFALISGLSSLTSSTPQEEEVQLVYDRPLENYEEAPFLQQNHIIAKYFWSDDCVDCDLAETALLNAKLELGNMMVIEKINIDSWPDHAESMNIESVPTIYLKGRTVVTTQTTDIDELVKAACPLYFYYIDECAFLT